MPEEINKDLAWWMKNRGIPFVSEVVAGWEKDEPLSAEKMAKMAELMTNLGRPVFAFKGGVPAEITTALFARYSRSPRPLRSLLVREFWGEKGLDLEKARTLATRVVQEYGDDSVKQLGVVSVACEMISQLAVKEIEDTRLGGFLEKSSRYVDFGKRVGDRYLYLRPREIYKTKLGKKYEKVMDEAFDLYKLAVEKLIVYLESKFHKNENVDEKVYRASIKAKALDIGRVFLPMATLTNAGVVLSTQSVEGMVNKMRASKLWESQQLAEDIQNEVHGVVPSLVRDGGSDEHAQAYINYLQKSRSEIEKINKKLVKKLARVGDLESGQTIELVWREEKALEKVVAGILYPESTNSLQEIEKLVEKMSSVEKKSIVDGYVAGRTNRRHKPGRAFELAAYTFEFKSKVAEWRDLQRHRILTPQRQLFTMAFGYAIPDEFAKVGMAEIYEKHMEKRRQLFEEIKDEISSEAAQYVVGFGNYMRWMIKANLRELYHLIPLRAGTAGHPDYRRIAREMFYKLAEVEPILAMPMERFIDFDDEVKLERLAQLTKVKAKLDKMGVNNSDTFGGE